MMYGKVLIFEWIMWSSVQLHTLVFMGMVLSAGDPAIHVMSDMQVVYAAYVAHMCTSSAQNVHILVPGMLILALTCPSAWPGYVPVVLPIMF